MTYVSENQQHVISLYINVDNLRELWIKKPLIC